MTELHLADARAQGAPHSARRDAIDAEAFSAARKFLDTGFGRIAYVERGVGPLALFLHGYPLNGFQWRGALHLLAPHRRCIAADFMGLGYTETPIAQDVSPQAQADMLASFLDALSIPRVDLIANDSGGTIAQLFVAQHPERVRTLLLTNCDVHENSPPPQFLPTVASARRGELAERFVLRSLDDHDYARSPRALGAFYTDPANLTAECVEAYLRPLVASPQRIAQFHAYTTAFLPNPLLALEPALKTCPVPARMVWGDASPAFKITWAHWLDRTLPRSQGVRAVAGANLFFPEEMPELIAEEAIALWNAFPP